MYTPNEHLDAAHQRLRHVTSDEVNADAPPQHPSAPAQSYDAWQHLPHKLSLVPNDEQFIAQQSLSPPPETYGFSDLVDDDRGFRYGPWEVPGSSLQPTFQDTPHHLPTQPLRNDALQPLQPNINRLNSTRSEVSHPYLDLRSLNQRHSVPNGLPLSPEDFLPQTRAYLASNACFDADTAPIWNIDGTQSNHENWTHSGPSQTDLFRQPQFSDYRAPYGAPFAQHSVHQFAPTQAIQPCHAASIASSPTLAGHHGQLVQMPVAQEWRTDNLTKTQKLSRKLPDAATRRMQEKYRRKGEARRNTIAAGMSQTLAHHPPLPSGPSKPKPATALPAKRRRIKTTVVPEVRHNSQLGLATNTYQIPYADQEYTGAAISYLNHPIPVHSSSTTELPPLTADELPQAVVSNYESYKWSVSHFQLQPKGYDFAQRWFQELFDTTLNAEYKERHVTHVSQGFIKDGDRYSVLVLHNAANPFEYEPIPKSTITIGVYGYHWYQHNEIHWTTLATDQRHLFVQCVEAGWLVEKYKWTHDAKPTEKRFHRAYWFAANRNDMGGLLNRGLSDDKPHDQVEERSEEDPDEDFSVNEADLTNMWDVTDTEAAAAWQNVLVEVEALGEQFDRSESFVGEDAAGSSPESLKNTKIGTQSINGQVTTPHLTVRL
ncbi:hypothetical protein N0V86_004769 [Didymella sp. IMI 355093]|nr:hypothetical protein N0V86_004769 [Didymella sp. IMI 355093]